AWQTLPLGSYVTANFTHSGRLTFDPPADWQTAHLSTGPGKLFYVRFRTVSGGTAPTAGTVLGRDFVTANGGSSGTVPAFDAAADANGDGYLGDAEFAHRRPGFDARFVYESRIFYPYHGQFRYV